MRDVRPVMLLALPLVVEVLLEPRNDFQGHDELPKREWHLESARPTYIKDTTRRNTTPSAVAAVAATAAR